MKAVFKKIIDLLEEKQQLHNANAEELKSKNRIGLTAIADARACAFYEAIEIVKQVAKGYKNGWIACSEKLPETYDNLIICQSDGYVNVGWYSLNEFKDLNSVPYKDVIAWQPLPEPYQIQSSSQITNQSTWKKQTMRRFEKVE